MSANSSDNAASFVGAKRPIHQVGRMEGREEKMKEVGMGLYSSRFWRPANRHEDKVYVMFIDKSKILLIYAHLNESLRKKKKKKSKWKHLPYLSLVF